MTSNETASAPLDVWAASGVDAQIRRAIDEYLRNIDVNARRRLRRRFAQASWVKAFATVLAQVSRVMAAAQYAPDKEFDSVLKDFLPVLIDAPEECWDMAHYYLVQAESVAFEEPPTQRYFDRCGQAQGEVERIILRKGPPASR